MKDSNYKTMIEMILNGISRRKIADVCGVSSKTITKYKKSLSENNITLKDIKYFSDADLSEIISPKKNYCSPETTFDVSGSVLLMNNWGYTETQAYEVYLKTHETPIEFNKFHDMLITFEQTSRFSEDDSVLPGKLMYVVHERIPFAVCDEETGEIRSAHVIWTIFPYSQYLFVYVDSDYNEKALVTAINSIFLKIGSVPLTLALKSSKASHTVRDGARCMRPAFEEMLYYYGIGLIDNEKLLSQKMRFETHNIIKDLQSSIMSDKPFASVGEMQQRLDNACTEYMERSDSLHRWSRNDAFAYEVHYMYPISDDSFEYFEECEVTAVYNYHMVGEFKRIRSLYDRTSDSREREQYRYAAIECILPLINETLSVMEHDYGTEIAEEMIKIIKEGQ